MHPCRTPLQIGNVSVVDPFRLNTAVWSICSDCNNATMCSGNPSSRIISKMCTSPQNVFWFCECFSVLVVYRTLSGFESSCFQ